MLLTKRTQILFDKQLWQKLVALSRSQKLSIGEIVRDAIEEKLSRQTELEKRKAAIEATLKHRPKPFKGKIDYKALINAGRKY